ncbi:MAG: CPBP family intramembrane glutamic endopeptidase [Chloroflexota bacterium]
MTAPLFSPENKLIRQPQSGKRITPIWAVIPLTFFILILSQMGAVIAVIYILFQRLGAEQVSKLVADGELETIVGQVQPQSAVDMMLFLITAFFGIYVLVGLWVRFFEGRPIGSLGLSTEHPFRQFWRGFLIGAGMFILAVLPGMGFGLFTLEVGPVFTTSVLTGVGLVLIGWLVQGSAEEFIFRGWIFPVISARYSLWLGILLSSLLFAVAHSLNPNIGWLAVLNLFLFGVFTALYALNEESIWGVCGIHAVWNWVQGNLLGLEVSGSRPGDVSLFVIKETGADMLTGGAFGPEGGLMVTAVLGIGIIVVFLVAYRKQGLV